MEMEKSNRPEERVPDWLLKIIQENNYNKEEIMKERNTPSPLSKVFDYPVTPCEAFIGKKVGEFEPAEFINTTPKEHKYNLLRNKILSYSQKLSGENRMEFMEFFKPLL